MSCGWLNSVTKVALGTAVTMALLTGMAHAKPWAEWAPDPLASDSAYAALSALPPDLLSAGELSWLAVQRDWRTQRTEEKRSAGSITQSWHPHRVRLADERFAALASRHYAALADTELAWLVAENRAQHWDRGPTHIERRSGAGTIFLAAIAGGLAGYLAFYFTLASALP